MKKNIILLFLTFSTFYLSHAEEKPPKYETNKKNIDEKLDKMNDKIYDGWGDISGGVGNEIDNLVSKDGLSSFLFNELGK